MIREAFKTLFICSRLKYRKGKIKHRHLISLIWAFLMLPAASAQATPVFIDSYQISYIYNGMESNNSGAPVNPVNYGTNVVSEPIKVPLSAGEYRINIVSGSETGNSVIKDIFDKDGVRDLDQFWQGLVKENNSSAEKYETGYNGGNTHPVNDPELWRSWVHYWVGQSPESGYGGAVWNTGNSYDFSINPDEDLWLFLKDHWTRDNLGGSTVELRRISETNPVPEPSTMLLLSCGLVGLAWQAQKRKKS